MKLFENRAKINELACDGLAGLLAAGGGLAWTQPTIAGSDLWWHLAAGREIWRSAGVPEVDAFSFTFAGREWVNHEWLWDVVVWALYRVDPAAVAWGQLLLLAALFGVLFEVCRRESGSRLAAVCSVWAAAATSHWFFDIRPHAVTLLLTALLLWVQPWRHAPWIWPGLIVLWANVHAGFVFGLGVIGLDVLMRTARASWPARRLHWSPRPWIGLLLAVAALLANPWGVEILGYPLAYLEGSSAYRELVEWHPTSPSLDPRSFAGRFWALALAAALSLPWSARRSPLAAGVSLVTFAMAVTARRFIPLFAVSSAPLIAAGLVVLYGAVRSRVRVPSHLALGGVAWGLVVLAGGLAWSEVRLLPRLLDRWTQHEIYPAAAIAHLRAAGPPQRLLNLYGWGGYVMLHLPESRVFIDGRANTLYDEVLFRDYQALTFGDPGSAARLARYRPDAALVRRGDGLSRTLQGRPGWNVIYRDQLAEILAPPGSPLGSQLAAVRRPLANAPQVRLLEVEELAAGGEPERARAKLRGILADEPLYPRAYVLLAELAANERDAGGIGGAIARGLRAYPRRAAFLHEAEGRAYERAGYLPRALRAYRAIPPPGPFRSEDPRPAHIRRVQERVRAGPEREEARE